MSRLRSLTTRWTDRSRITHARPGLYPVLFALLVMLLTLQCERLFWAAVVPLGPFGAWRPSAAETLAPAERVALFAAFDPFFRAGGAAPASATVTAANLTLYGVRVNEAAGGGGAIIAGGDGVQQSYAVGEEVQPGVTLYAVAFDHVVLDRGGVRESLYLDQSVPAPVAGAPAPGGATAAAPVAPPPAPLSRDPATPPPLPSAPPAGKAAGPGARAPAARSPASGGTLDAAALRGAVALEPRREGGRVTGLALAPRGDGALFRAAGLKAGDIVTAVNGRPIASAADLAAQLRPGARLSLAVERGTGTVPVNIFLGTP